MRGLVKRWPGRPAPILDGVDLDVAAGSVVWLRGENGAGKTTLLRVVTGVLTPDAGDVQLAGADLRSDRRALLRRVGFLPAGNAGLYGRITVAAHLDLWVRVAFVAPAERADHVARAVRDFALERLLAVRADRISMGQRQRLRLAMAFLADPLVVLLDEPRASLDEAGTAALAGAVEDVRGRGGCVVWSSPSGDAPPIPVDRRLLLERGRLEER